MSYTNNNYGIGADGALPSSTLQGFGGPGVHTGYMTSLGHNSDSKDSPRQLLTGNKSHINFRHSRVQSNIVDSFNARIASQSALGLVTNLPQS